MRSSEKHNDLWCWSSQPVKTIYARFSSPETSRSRIIITPREMMDRVSRKDHRYVVLTKNDLIASKTFFKNFLPPTRACVETTPFPNSLQSFRVRLEERNNPREIPFSRKRRNNPLDSSSLARRHHHYILSSKRQQHWIVRRNFP